MTVDRGQGTGDRGGVWNCLRLTVLRCLPAGRQAGGSVAMVADAGERAKGEVAGGGGTPTGWAGSPVLGFEAMATGALK